MELKTRQQCIGRGLQLVKLSVLFDYPGAILGLTHVAEHSGAEREQILEVVVTAALLLMKPRRAPDCRPCMKCPLGV